MVLLVGLTAKGAFQAGRMSRDRDKFSAQLLDLLNPPSTESTDADKAVKEVLALCPPDERASPLWGLGQGPKLPRTPTVEAATAQLEMSTHFIERLRAVIRPELESTGSAPVLMQSHSYRTVRSAANALGDATANLYRVGKTKEAALTLEAGHRLTRLVGRGILGQSSIIAKVVVIGAQRALDQVMGVLLQRHLIPPDPGSQKPYRLMDFEGRKLLYGFGPDGKDDGGDGTNDAVVWR